MFRLLLLLVPLLGQGASQGVSRGVLVHHRPSGKLYAVNAHLEPGQLFRTGDGRVFTLANSGDLGLGGDQHLHQGGDQHLHQGGQHHHQQGDTRQVPAVPALSPAPAPPVQVASQVHALPLRVVDTAAPRVSPSPSRMSPSLLTNNVVTPTPSSALVEGFFSFPSAGIDYQFKQRNKI